MGTKEEDEMWREGHMAHTMHEHGRECVHMYTHWLVGSVEYLQRTPFTQTQVTHTVHAWEHEIPQVYTRRVHIPHRKDGNSYAGSHRHSAILTTSKLQVEMFDHRRCQSMGIWIEYKVISCGQSQLWPQRAHRVTHQTDIITESHKLCKTYWSR